MRRSGIFTGAKQGVKDLVLNEDRKMKDRKMILHGANRGNAERAKHCYALICANGKGKPRRAKSCGDTKGASPQESA